MSAAHNYFPSIVAQREQDSPAEARPRVRLRRILFLAARMLLIALAVRAFIGEASLVPTPSMENTVMVGDHLFWIKALYGPEVPFTNLHLPRLRHVHRGDIIAFRYPRDPRQVFLKRAVATSGDLVEMRAGVFYLNGVAQQESYVMPGSIVRTLPQFREFPRTQVPQGELFVLGDNRDNSADSREFGFVPEANVVGEPVMVLWSYDAPSASWLDERPRRELAFYSSIVTHLVSRTRWSRVGTVF